MIDNKFHRGNGDGNICPTLTKEAAGDRPSDYAPMVFTQNQSGDILTGTNAPAMGTNSNATGRNTPKIQQGAAVRRLTPKETERLQGFPDDYTRIQWRGKKPEDCPDGPRYKAIGNSWAVPCARWIGERIKEVINQNEKRTV